MLAAIAAREPDLVEAFRSGYRYAPTAQRIGFEAEYPVVSRDGRPVPHALIERTWRRLAAAGWKPDAAEGDDRTITTGVRRARDDGFEDILTMDAGYHLLELKLAPCASMSEVERRLADVTTNIAAALGAEGARALGLGVHPTAPADLRYLTPLGRYRLLAQDGAAFPRPIIYPFVLSAAAQTHVDVDADEAASVVTALNLTAGLRIALLANSPFLAGGPSAFQATRERFYDDWYGPHRPGQIGIPERFPDLRSYVDRLLDFRCLMVRRDDGWYALDSDRPFRCFLTSAEPWTGRDHRGVRRELTPTLEDLFLQAGFAWFQARLQPRYGTVEDRVACQQPPEEQLVAAALTLGLVANAGGLRAVADLLSIDQWRGIRSCAIRRGLAASFPGVDVGRLCERLLAAAREGLEKRQLREEGYLDPLSERLRRGRGPADRARSWYEEGGVAAVVDRLDMRRYADARSGCRP